MRRFILFMLCWNMAFAQKPVRVDEILTQENSFRLDSTFTYSNIQSGGAFSTSQTFQTQNGDFVNIPVYLGATKNNQDYLNIDLTLRYGMMKDIELFISINGYSSDTKLTLPRSFQHQSDSGFNAFVTGLTYQIKPEDDTPSLLLGASMQVIEKNRVNDTVFTNRFKSFRLFATSYYSVDPVVFLLSASYGLHLSKNLDVHKRDDGDVFTLSPQVYFAVNPYTSINWGVKYGYYGKTKIDGEIVANSGSNLSFMTGLSYEFSTSTFVNIDAEFLNTDALSQNRLSFTVSYKF